MPVILDPESLPELDVLVLARTGILVRAERETPADGIPAFLTCDGWNELIARYKDGSEPPSETAIRILPVLERIVTRLLAEAARYCTHPANIRNCHFTLESDLFSMPETWLLLVRDKTHSVACAILGTPTHISRILDRSFHIGTNRNSAPSEEPVAPDPAPE